MNTAELLTSSLVKAANEAAELDEYIAKVKSHRLPGTLQAAAISAIPGLVVGGTTGLFGKKEDRKKRILRNALIGGLVTGLAGGGHSLGYTNSALNTAQSVSDRYKV